LGLQRLNLSWQKFKIKYTTLKIKIG